MDETLSMNVPPDPYMVSGGDAWLVPPPPPRPPSAGDRALAALAHGAIVFGFVGIGFLLALGINLGLWLYSRRSDYVGYHARQAGCYQAFVLVFNLGLAFVILLLFGFYLLYPQWTAVGALAGWLLVAGLVWFAGSILFGVAGAVLVLLGRPFAYPWLGRRGGR